MQRIAVRAIRRLPPRPAEFALRTWALISGRRLRVLAADSAFWAVFSLPWLILAVVTGMGVVSALFGSNAVDRVNADIVELAESIFTSQSARGYAIPAINELFGRGRAGLGLLGTVIAFYSGSRAVLSLLEAIALINGQIGRRRFLRARVLAFVLYIAGVLLIALALAWVTVATDAIAETLQTPRFVFQIGDAAVLGLLALVLILSIFHFAGSPRMPLRSELPGAVLSVGVGSLFLLPLFFYLRYLFNSGSVVGLVTGPIAIMYCAYLLALITLTSAAVNAVRLDRPILTVDDLASQRLADLERT